MRLQILFINPVWGSLTFVLTLLTLLRHKESLAIYNRALEIAIKELGISHAYTQLTRANKVRFGP